MIGPLVNTGHAVLVLGLHREDTSTSNLHMDVHAQGLRFTQLVESSPACCYWVPHPKAVIIFRLTPVV